MKTYEDYKREFDTEKEYSREDVKEIMDILERNHNTMINFTMQFERVFLVAGEACGYDAQDVCGKCQGEKL